LTSAVTRPQRAMSCPTGSRFSASPGVALMLPGEAVQGVPRSRHCTWANQIIHHLAPFLHILPVSVGHRGTRAAAPFCRYRLPYIGADSRRARIGRIGPSWCRTYFRSRLRILRYKGVQSGLGNSTRGFRETNLVQYRIHQSVKLSRVVTMERVLHPSLSDAPEGGEPLSDAEQAEPGLGLDTWLP